MLRLCRSVTGITLLAALAVGCGSSGGDRTVFRFVSFDNTGLTQEDSVRAASADVDVVQDICSIAMDGTRTFERITQTVINATFVNEGAADIQLERYTVDAGSESGLGARDRTIAANIPGGRCSILPDRHCAVDSDCVVAGSAQSGTCNHSDTTVSAVLLFDFDDKLHVDPAVFDQAQNVTVSFYGVDDTNTQFKVTTKYVVTFADFDNCMATGGGAAGGS